MSRSITTLADVLKTIDGDQELTPKRRAEIKSALRTMARAFGRSLGDLPADPKRIRRQLEGFSPASAGIEKARWQNVRSLVLAALKRVGAVSMSNRHDKAMSPEWRALYYRLETHRHRAGLSRFMRFCSETDIRPEHINNAVMERYLHTLTEESLVKNPREKHRRTCRLWNEAADKIPGWPQNRVTVPSYKERISLPWEAFPPSLHDETLACLGRLRNPDPFDSDVARPFDDSTLRLYEYQIRLFASALVHLGVERKTLTSLSVLCDPALIKNGLRFFLERSGGRKTAQIYNIACTLKTFARCWVKPDPNIIDEIATICRQVDPKRRGLTEKNKARLRQFDDPDNIRALVNLPERLVKEAKKAKLNDRRKALLVQTALAIELLVMCPIRLGNLTQLRLDRHFQRSKPGSCGAVHLVIPAAEVKNEQDLEFELPPPTKELLSRYVHDHRPHLLSGAFEWLFPGRDPGKHMNSGKLKERVQKTIKDRTGLDINPHLFRHLAAKIHLDQHPGEYETVRRVLGHRSIATTTSYYTGLEVTQALKHYDQTILGYRDDSH